MTKHDRQGPRAGRTLPSERYTYTDSYTGTTVHRMTDSRAHDHHLYFTNSGWYDDCRRLLFASDRTGAPNLYSVHVETGEITQLTDLSRPAGDNDRRGYSFPFLFTAINPDGTEAYFWHEDDLLALDLETCELRSLYEKPAGYLPTITNVTADGTAVCTAIFEDVTGDIPDDVAWNPWTRADWGMETFCDHEPTSKVLSVPVDGREATVLHEEEFWINHVNTSPTNPDVLTFCHEGFWSQVDQRIWGLNRATNDTWRIRETEDEEHIGHEYWLADGKYIGYHGHRDDGDAFYGTIRYDNTERVETTVPGGYTHFHSLDRDIVVGDGSEGLPYVLVWQYDTETATFSEPRRLARHDCSFHVQGLHVHAQMSPSGEHVVFTSDRSGYGNVYVAELPDFKALPQTE